MFRKESRQVFIINTINNNTWKISVFLQNFCFYSWEQLYDHWSPSIKLKDIFNCGIAFPTEKKLAEVLGLSISTKKDLKADDNGQMYNVSIQQYTRPTTKKTS